MKYLLVIFVFFFSIKINIAQKVNFESSLNEAFVKAKLADKLVFIEYYNENCHVCQSLEPVFSDILMSNFYNTHFINYKLNTENIKSEDQQFMDNSGLQPESVPIFFFFDKNQQFVHVAFPSQDIQSLIEIGMTAQNENDCAANLSHKYEKGDRTIKTLYAYSNLAQLYKQDSLVAILADDLFQTFPKENLGNKKSYIITKNCVTSIENGFFRYWINNIDQLKGLETGRHEGTEKEVLGKILAKSMNSSASKSWDLPKIQAVKQIIITLEYSDNPDAFFGQQESHLLLQAGRTKEALQLCERLLAHPKTEAKAAINYLTFFLNNIDTKQDLTMLKKYLDEQATKAEDTDDKANFEQLKLLYFEKINTKN